VGLEYSGHPLGGTALTLTQPLVSPPNHLLLQLSNFQLANSQACNKYFNVMLRIYRKQEQANVLDDVGG